MAINSKQVPTPVTFTGPIPVCPYCKVGTIRTNLGGTTTSMGHVPGYDEFGNEISGDPNTVSTVYRCHSCSNYYGVATRNGQSEYYEVKQP